MPDAFFAALCAQSANLLNGENSLELAGIHGNLAMTEVANQTRRPFGPVETPTKRNVLMADVDDWIAAPAPEAESQKSRSAYQESKEKL